MMPTDFTLTMFTKAVWSGDMVISVQYGEPKRSVGLSLAAGL